jgi:enoyl-CoA hydratase/carnithine racemase
MSTDILLIEQVGRVRTLTFNRPEQLNAMNDALYDATACALDEAAADRGVAAVVLTGAGRAFCAGLDVNQMASGPPSYPAGEVHGFKALMNALEVFSKPLLAAVNGTAVGLGLTILPHCDFVVIDEKARLRAPFAALGIAPEAASSVLLPMLVGWANAADILFRAPWIDAEMAVAFGLAREKAPAGQALARAQVLAEEIASHALDSLIATKKLLLAARRDAVCAARIREDTAFDALRGGPANREALAALREKRKSDFTAL